MTTPKQLAAEIGLSPKTVRAYLRKRWPRTPERKHHWWQEDLTPEMIADVREHFAS
jgi:hypothetical protein